MHTLSRLLVLLAHLLAACGANAEGSLFKVPTRDGVVTTLFWETAPNAQATVLLFPGGDGGFGKLENGKATSSNFLVRSTPLFLVNGFNVAIFGRPTDTTALGWADRTEANHMTDIAKVLTFVKQKSSLPVWIVGTTLRYCLCHCDGDQGPRPRHRWAGTDLQRGSPVDPGRGIAPRPQGHPDSGAGLPPRSRCLHTLQAQRHASDHREVDQCAHQKTDVGGWRVPPQRRCLREPALARIRRHGATSHPPDRQLDQEPHPLRQVAEPLITPHSTPPPPARATARPAASPSPRSRWPGGWREALGRRCSRARPC